MTYPHPHDLESRYGIALPGFKGWIDDDARRAADAALPTLPNNAGVPAEFTQYIDPRVVEILTAPERARLLFDEVKVGDWTTSHFKFRVDELLGRSVPYSDFARGGAVDVNSSWLTREQYRFQTTMRYGELEAAVAGSAKLDVAASKQRAAARVIENDSNRFYLYGVAAKAVYGFLNDPSLPAPVAVAAGETSGNTAWSGKTPDEIFADVQGCFARLAAKSKGLVDATRPLRMAISPAMSVYLLKATTFNVSVQDMLGKAFTDLKFVVLPEMTGAGGVETAIMFPTSIDGHPVAELAYGDKLRAHAMRHELTSFEQKFSATTYGCVVYYPVMFSGISGMEG
jgi:hypothetical protein